METPVTSEPREEHTAETQAAEQQTPETAAPEETSLTPDSGPQDQPSAVAEEGETPSVEEEAVVEEAEAHVQTEESPEGTEPTAAPEEEPQEATASDEEAPSGEEEAEAQAQAEEAPEATEPTVAPEEESQEAATSDEEASSGEEEAESDVNPMEALLEESFELRRFRRGQIVEGTIVAIEGGEIVIDIGGKSEGIVPSHDVAQLDPEFVNSLQVGDTVVAYVLQPEGRDGHTILSLVRAQAARDWRWVEELAKTGEIIEAPVIEANRGGVIVKVGQLRGFVPASQLERRGEAGESENREERFNFLLGQTLKLKVLEADRRRKRLILSERQAMREVREKEKERLLQELREGEVRRGRVTSLTKFGAFVDIGGIDGLVHISELAWRHVKHPSEVVQVGDEVDVYVLSVDRERGRVGLSIRRLLPKPWETVLDRYAIGEVVEGTVTKIVPFGVFVRLEDGIEGLVHISELADRRVEHPREVVKEGDRVRVRILRIDPEAKRMGLSLKQAAEDAYVEIDWDVAEEEEEEETGTWDTLAEVGEVEEDEAVEEVEEAATGEEDASQEELPSDEESDSSSG